MLSWKKKKWENENKIQLETVWFSYSSLHVNLFSLSLKAIVWNELDAWNENGFSEKIATDSRIPIQTHLKN